MTTFILPSVKIWQNGEKLKAHKPLQLTALQNLTSYLLKWIIILQSLYKYSQAPAES